MSLTLRCAQYLHQMLPWKIDFPNFEDGGSQRGTRAGQKTTGTVVDDDNRAVSDSCRRRSDWPRGSSRTGLHMESEACTGSRASGRNGHTEVRTLSVSLERLEERPTGCVIWREHAGGLPRYTVSRARPRCATEEEKGGRLEHGARTLQHTRESHLTLHLPRHAAVRPFEVGGAMSAVEARDFPGRRETSRRCEQNVPGSTHDSHTQYSLTQAPCVHSRSCPAAASAPSPDESTSEF